MWSSRWTVHYEPKLVIDGSMIAEALRVAQHSASYFMNIDSANICDLSIHAKVTVSDGSTQEILTLKRDDNFFAVSLSGDILEGRSGKTYTLTWK